MNDKRNTKKIVKNISNVLFIGVLLLLIFSPGAKAWFLKQLLSVGLFKAEIKKESPSPKSLPVNFYFGDAKGNIISSNDLKGKVVFINFWATWCPPCRAEMPSLDKLYKQFQNDDRFVFLFLNEDEDVGNARGFLADNGYSFPIARRVGNITNEVFSGTLPTTVILSRDSRIVMKHEGIASYNNGSFIEQLKSLL
jgi:thiol-disulfide isomerase/thioredoxin